MGNWVYASDLGLGGRTVSELAEGEREEMEVILSEDAKAKPANGDGDLSFWLTATIRLAVKGWWLGLSP